MYSLISFHFIFKTASQLTSHACTCAETQDKDKWFGRLCLKVKSSETVCSSDCVYKYTKLKTLRLHDILDNITEEAKTFA